MPAKRKKVHQRLKLRKRTPPTFSSNHSGVPLRCDAPWMSSEESREERKRSFQSHNQEVGDK
jgi:hypothetical protein